MWTHTITFTHGFIFRGSKSTTKTVYNNPREKYPLYGISYHPLTCTCKDYVKIIDGILYVHGIYHWGFCDSYVRFLSCDKDKE